MSGISAVLISICVSAVTGGVFYMLLPDGEASRVMKTVIGVFMLGCIVLPLFSIDYDDIDLDLSEVSLSAGVLSSAVGENTAAVTARTVETALEKDFRESGIRAEADAETGFDDGGGIIITRVRIYLNQSDADKIKKLEGTVQNECGQNTAVEFIFNNPGSSEGEE